MHWASKGNSLELIKELIRKDKSLLNLVDNDGNTPLHCVVHSALNDLHQTQFTLDMIKLFVENGATKDVKNIHGQTPLDIIMNNSNRCFLRTSRRLEEFNKIKLILDDQVVLTNNVETRQDSLLMKLEPTDGNHSKTNRSNRLESRF